MLAKNGLVQDAQRELIDLVYKPGVDGAEKARALDLLATIAVERNNLRAALDSWNQLIREFPDSAEAQGAKEKLPLLVNVIGKLEDEGVSDARALLYLRAGDFWSKGRDTTFGIDSSWISNVEAAAVWYDRVIAELPGRPAARIAFEEKMRTLLGWKDPGQDGEAHGVKASASYLPQLEDTFRSYERAFPKAPAAQAFRFQIAQAYWEKKNWAKTREWLNEIIVKDGGANSFYRDLAERRLEKVEY
jgi:tetratricopeptide (TPR) repeat protein